MTSLRAIIALAAVAACASPVIGEDVLDTYDHEAYRKRRAAREAEQAERQRGYEKRRAEREQARREAVEREERRVAMLAAGMDPTNGRPLSRQQRRAQERNKRNG